MRSLSNVPRLRLATRLYMEGEGEELDRDNHRGPRGKQRNIPHCSTLGNPRAGPTSKNRMGCNSARRVRSRRTKINPPTPCHLDHAVPIDAAIQLTRLPATPNVLRLRGPTEPSGSSSSEVLTGAQKDSIHPNVPAYPISARRGRLHADTPHQRYIQARSFN